jgi:hypothetical protein
LRRAGDEAFQLTIDYLKQEALEPLKGLGRFLAWGLAGSLAIGVGVLILLLGILRLLQDETGTALTGDWSWVPYFAVSVIGIGVAAVAVWRITAGPGKAKLPKKGASPKADEVKVSAGAATALAATGEAGTGPTWPVAPAGSHPTEPAVPTVPGVPTVPTGTDSIATKEGSS